MKSSAGGNAKTAEKANEKSYPFISFLITFVVMFLSWIILSGKFDPLLLGLGFFSSALVAYLSHDLLVPTIEPASVRIFFRFVQYIPWLLYQIMKANVHMLRLAFHPKMEKLIDPKIIKFQTNLKTDMAITTLANSITLTPGTITVQVDSDGVFSVHAIDNATAEACPGAMLEKVAYIFGEQI